MILFTKKIILLFFCVGSFLNANSEIKKNIRQELNAVEVVSTIYDVRDYGAKGDGVTLNTKAFHIGYA